MNPRSLAHAIVLLSTSLICACAAPTRSPMLSDSTLHTPVQERAAPSGASRYSPAATQVAQQLMTFLTTVPSSDALTAEWVGQQFKVMLPADDERSVYRSGNLGDGWNYGVAVTPGNRTMKRGFEFWFYNPALGPDPTPICALNMNALRQHLVAHGFVERVVPWEGGGTDGSDFLKDDLVLTITGRDVVIAPNGDECIVRLQTTDGR